MTAKHLTTREDIERFTECWKRLLGLTQWDIVISFHKELSDSMTMSVAWVRGYLSAGLSVSEDALFLQPSRAEKAVIHELLHLVFAPVDDRMTLIIGCGTALLEYRQEMERAIDGLSVRLEEGGYV